MKVVKEPFGARQQSWTNCLVLPRRAWCNGEMVVCKERRSAVDQNVIGAKDDEALTRTPPRDFMTHVGSKYEVCGNTTSVTAVKVKAENYSLKRPIFQWGQRAKDQSPFDESRVINAGLLRAY